MNFDKTSNRAVMKGERFFFAIFFIYAFFFPRNLLILDKAERLRANKRERVENAKKSDDVNLIRQSAFE